MRERKTGSAVLLVCGLLGAWALGGPTRAMAEDAPAAARTLTIAMPKAGRTRPLVAIVADNAGTETTDFIVPYAILKRSGAVDVVAVSADEGTVELMPALRMLADTTFDRFDATVPAGADVVIVPALHRADRPAVL
ncbi:thiamine biosynthesis protein ThiJ, partial [Burkholderia cenocepacia]